MVERHNILEPADLMLAQYSIPFCVALALHREARDPESFDETRTPRPTDPRPCPRVRLVPEAGAAHAGMGVRSRSRSPTAASKAAPRMGCSNPARSTINSCA